MSRPLTSVTIDVPLVEKTEFPTNPNKTTADGDIINKNQITRDAGTYELHMKLEQPAKQFDTTVAALKGSKRHFEAMLPDELHDNYIVMIHDMDVTVNASHNAMVAAANLRRANRSNVSSLFSAVERINRLPGFLTVPSNFLTWFHDYGPETLDPMNREEAIDWLDTELND